MQPGSEDGVFGDEEDFFLIRVEGAVDKGVSEGLYILLFLGLDEPLINNFLFHFHRVYNTKGKERLF